MNPLYHEAAKRVLAREFCIEGLNDPEEVRHLLNAKLAGLSAVDRTALTIQLGQALEELEADSRPSGTIRTIVHLLFAVIAWWVWRPAGVLVAIFGLANFRYFAIRHSLFWSPLGAIVIGSLYGTAVALLIAIAAPRATASVLGVSILALVGLFGVGYIAYGVEPNLHLRIQGDDKRVAAGGAAVATYLVCLVAWFSLRALLERR
jgi:hypothetical protein